MDALRLGIHTGLILCLIGIGLTIAANQWDGLRRFKIVVTIILIGYLLVTCLRP